MVTGKNIVEKLVEQDHIIPEQAKKAICFFNKYTRPTIQPCFIAIIQRANHILDRAEIYVDITTGYISLVDYTVSSIGTKTIINARSFTWLKDSQNRYLFKQILVNPTFIRESKYYEKKKT